MSPLLASMTRRRSRRTGEGILALLLHNRAFPLLVIHTFVPFAIARPSAMWTWAGSKGSFSLDQN